MRISNGLSPRQRRSKMLNDSSQNGWQKCLPARPANSADGKPTANWAASNGNLHTGTKGTALANIMNPKYYITLKKSDFKRLIFP